MLQQQRVLHDVVQQGDVIAAIGTQGTLTEHSFCGVEQEVVVQNMTLVSCQSASTAFTRA